MIPPDSRAGAPPERQRLESWKEIATHLRRTVRTVQRWEREQSLPIHRLVHNKLSTVYAYVDELDDWRASRRAVLDEQIDDAVEDAAVEQTQSVSEAPPTPPAPTRRAMSSWRLALGLGALALVAAIPLVSYSAIVQRLTRPEAQRLIDVGRRAWNERTPSGFARARNAFEQAAAADPTNALAYCGLADTYALFESFGLMTKADALGRARAAATRALALAPDLGEAHTSMGFVEWEEGDRVQAMQEIEKAIALNPRYATARHWHALFLQDMGRLPDALDEGRRASALDTDSPVIVADMALMLRNGGRLEESQEMLEALLARFPSYAGVHVELAETYRRKKQYALALERMRSAVQNGDDRPAIIARLAWLEAKNGNRYAAFDAARRMKVDEARGLPVPDAIWLEALTAAGDLDAAADCVEKVVAMHQDWAVRITTDELFEGLRRHPRWPELRNAIVAMSETLAPMKVTPPLDR